MNKSPLSFIQHVFTLVNKSFNYLKIRLNSTYDYLFEKKQKLELNKPSDTQAHRLMHKKTLP